MPSQNRRNLLRRRRRLEEDGDDDGEAVAHADDSHSDNSGPSDDDGDADDSDLSETDRPDLEDAAKANGTGKVDTVTTEASAIPVSTHPGKENSFTTSKETDVMMNGLSISEEVPQEEPLDFEGGQDSVAAKSDSGVSSTQNGPRRQESFAERKRREHEEYKKKRDENPAFIPTRGAFFMHDQRSAQAQHGARILGRGRGRGREVVGGPYSPAK